MPNIEEITAHFRMEGVFISARLFGAGHINDTYLVNTGPGNSPDYILQRINQDIFTNIPELTNNILKTTHHLRQKLMAAAPEFERFQIIHLIPSNNGAFYFHDREGNFWRLYHFIDDGRSYNLFENRTMAYEAGRAFGLFHFLTSDMDPSILFVVLPGFHDVSLRLQKFRKTVALDPAGRVAAVKNEIRFVETRAEKMVAIQRLGEQGKIPLRVTHNDTKCNNVLFNAANEAIAIVDLDTIMPGYSLYDFGDAIRTGANTAVEDEADFRKAVIDLELFEAYSRGYLSFAGKFLNPVEIQHLVFSARFMTYLIGLRFLTDHIDGDHYYKTAFPGHNLQRARVQFNLLESMEEKAVEMEKIIAGLTG